MAREYEGVCTSVCLRLAEVVRILYVSRTEHSRREVQNKKLIKKFWKQEV